MPAMRFEITKYKYDLRLISATTKVWMSLYDENSDCVAYALFLEQDTIAQPAKLNPDDKKIWLYFKKNDLSSVIDLLRNEKPIYLHYMQDGFATLSTLAEPVGVNDEELNYPRMTGVVDDGGRTRVTP